MSPSLNAFPAQDKPKKLLDQVRDLMRLRHYSFAPSAANTGN